MTFIAKKTEEFEMEKKMMLTKPEYGWTNFKLPQSTYGFALSYLTDIPVGWLRQAVDGLKNRRPFCVSGECEPGLMICVVSFTGCYLMFDDYDDHEELVEVERVNLGMFDFCKLLYDDICSNTDDWADWLMRGQNIKSRREKEIDELLNELNELIESIEEKQKIKKQRIEEIAEEGNKEFEMPLYLERSANYDDKMKKELYESGRLSADMVYMPSIEESLPVVQYLAGEQASIKELGLSVRTYCCLMKGGINNFGKLSGMTVDEIHAIRNMGRKSTYELVEKIKEITAILRSLPL